MAYHVSGSSTSSSRDSSPNPYSEESGESNDSAENSRNKDEDSSSSKHTEVDAGNSKDQTVSTGESESASGSTPSDDFINEDSEFDNPIQDSRITEKSMRDSVYAEHSAASERTEDGTSSSEQSTDTETAGSKENNSESTENSTSSENQNTDSESRASDESHSKMSGCNEGNTLSTKHESTDTETDGSKENSGNTEDTTSSEHQNTDSESRASEESHSKMSGCNESNTLSTKRASPSKESNSEKSENAEESTSTIKHENSDSETGESEGSSENSFPRGNTDDELKYISAGKCAQSSSRQRNKSESSVSKNELQTVLSQGFETRVTTLKKRKTVALTREKAKNSTISCKTQSTSGIRGRSTEPISCDEEASMYLKFDSNELLSQKHAAGPSSQKGYRAMSSKCEPEGSPSKKRNSTKPSCGTVATSNEDDTESSNSERLELAAATTKNARKTSRGRGVTKTKRACVASSRGRGRGRGRGVKPSQTRGTSKSSRRGRGVKSLEVSNGKEHSPSPPKRRLRRRPAKTIPEVPLRRTVKAETIHTTTEEMGMRFVTRYDRQTKKYTIVFNDIDTNIHVATTETECYYKKKIIPPECEMNMPSCSYQSKTPEHEGNTDASSEKTNGEDISPKSLEREAYGTIWETVTEDSTLPSKCIETDESEERESEKFETIEGSTSSNIQSPESETDEHNSKKSKRIEYVRQDERAETVKPTKLNKSKSFGKSKNLITRPENYPERHFFRNENQSETSTECVGESFTDRNNPVTPIKCSIRLSRTRGSERKTPSNYAKEHSCERKQKQSKDETRTPSAEEWDSPGTEDKSEMSSNENSKKCLKNEREQYEALDLTIPKEQIYHGSDRRLMGEVNFDDVDKVAGTVEESSESSLNVNSELQSEIKSITMDELRETLALMRAKSLRFYDHLLLEMDTNSEIYFIVKALRQSIVSGRTFPLDYSEKFLNKFEAEKQIKTFYKPSKSKTKARRFASSRRNQLEESGDSLDENLNKVIVMLEKEMKRCQTESDSKVQNKFGSFGSKLCNERFEPLNSDLPEVSNRILEEDLYLSESTSKSSEESPNENIGRLPLQNIAFKSTSKSDESLMVTKKSGKLDAASSKCVVTSSESVEGQQEVYESESKSSESRESSEDSSEKSTTEGGTSKSTTLSSKSDEETKSQENTSSESETQFSEYERSLDESSKTSSEQSTEQSLQLESAAMHTEKTKCDKSKTSDIQTSKFKSDTNLSSSSESPDASEILSPRKRQRTTEKISERMTKKNETQSEKDSRKRHASEKDWLSKRKREAEDH